MNRKDKMYICSNLLFAGSVLWIWYAVCIWYAFLKGRTYSQVSLSLIQDFNLWGEMLFELVYIPLFSLLLLICNIYIVRIIKREF